MLVDKASGLVTWTPGLGDVGSHVVTLEVDEADPACNTGGGTSLGTQTFTLEVKKGPLSESRPGSLGGASAAGRRPRQQRRGLPGEQQRDRCIHLHVLGSSPAASG